jgi:dephospho-CoA kinase
VLRVGLTGGIASGKSTVADLFAARGVTVLDTDRIAREVVAPGMPALGALVSALGGGILAQDGTLDRAALRRRIFSDEAARRTVESILHPEIMAELDRQSQHAPGPYQLFVIPLLVERGYERSVDRVLVVDCPEETQIARLMARDGETRDGAIRMLATQASREQRLAAAHDVVENDGSREDLAGRVAALDAKYREMAANY